MSDIPWMVLRLCYVKIELLVELWIKERPFLGYTCAGVRVLLERAQKLTCRHTIYFTECQQLVRIGANV